MPDVWWWLGAAMAALVTAGLSGLLLWGLVSTMRWLGDY